MSEPSFRESSWLRRPLRRVDGRSADEEGAGTTTAAVERGCMASSELRLCGVAEFSCLPMDRVLRSLRAETEEVVEEADWDGG